MTSKPFSGLTDHSIKENNHRKGRTDDGDKDKKEVVEGKKVDENHCSNEVDGPMRLSYAQVAQSGKEKAPPIPQLTTPTQPSANPQTGSSPPSASQSIPNTTTQEDKKKPLLKDKERDAKDIRTSSKMQRGNNSGGNRDHDRDRNDRNFRRTKTERKRKGKEVML